MQMMRLRASETERTSERGSGQGQRASRPQTAASRRSSPSPPPDSDSEKRDRKDAPLVRTVHIRAALGAYEGLVRRAPRLEGKDEHVVCRGGLAPARNPVAALLEVRFDLSTREGGERGKGERGGGWMLASLLFFFADEREGGREGKLTMAAWFLRRGSRRRAFT